ncbi:MAG: hypothetical protein PHT94_03940 [Candidatus Nanoarchaeia archaeon]|nr:hypothetical protein [Candidatus Nanoarchaeia archaeon]
MKKKSQVELFGLAVFVMLIVIGLLVLVVLNKKQIESKENYGVTRYLDNKLASETLNLIIATSVKDSSIKMQDLLRSHIRKMDVNNIPNTKTALDEVFGKILNATLVENGYDYYIFASTDNIEELCTSDYGEKCNSSLFVPSSFETFYEFGNREICFCDFAFSGTPGYVVIQLNSDQTSSREIYVYLSIQSTKLALQQN